MYRHNINILIKHHFHLVVHDIQDPNNYNENFGIDPYNWNTLEDYANNEIVMMFNEYPWNYVSRLNEEIQEVCDMNITLSLLQYIVDCDWGIDLNEIIQADAEDTIYRYIYMFVREECLTPYLYDIKILFDLNKEKLEKEDVLNFKYIVSPKKKLPNDVDNIIISYLAPSFDEIENNDNWR